MQIFFNEKLVIDLFFLCISTVSLCLELCQLLVSLLQGVLLETSLELRLCDFHLTVLSFSHSLLSVQPLLLLSFSLLFGDFLLSLSLSFFKRFSEFNLLLSLDFGDFSKASLFCRLCSFLLCGKPCHLRLLLASFSFSLLS